MTQPETLNECLRDMLEHAQWTLACDAALRDKQDALVECCVCGYAECADHSKLFYLALCRCCDGQIEVLPGKQTATAARQEPMLASIGERLLGAWHIHYRHMGRREREQVDANPYHALVQAIDLRAAADPWIRDAALRSWYAWAAKEYARLTFHSQQSAPVDQHLTLLLSNLAVASSYGEQ